MLKLAKPEPVCLELPSGTVCDPLTGRCDMTKVLKFDPTAQPQIDEVDDPVGIPTKSSILFCQQEDDLDVGPWSGRWQVIAEPAHQTDYRLILEVKLFVLEVCPLANRSELCWQEFRCKWLEKNSQYHGLLTQGLRTLYYYLESGSPGIIFVELNQSNSDQIHATDLLDLLS